MNRLIVTGDVDVTNGVQQMINKVTSQIKSVTPIIFGVLALIALIFTLVKGFKALIAYRGNQDYNVVPVITGGIATVIMGLLTSASFFGWFGF